MAFRTFTRKADARKFADAITDRNGGRLPSFMHDGKLWRVKDDSIGNDLMSAICQQLGLDG